MFEDKANVVFDWLGREGWIILNWWLLATLAGFTVLPMLVRLLGGLPDRGYTLARPAGMLLIGFVFWFLAILGFLDNSPGSIFLSWIIVLGVSLGHTLRQRIPLFGGSGDEKTAPSLLPAKSCLCCCWSFGRSFGRISMNWRLLKSRWI